MKKLIVLFLVLSACSNLPMERSRQAKTQGTKSSIRRPQLPPATAESHLASGQKFFQAREYLKSLDHYLVAEQQLAGLPKQKDAQWGAFRSAAKINRWPEVAEMSNKLLAHGGWLESQTSELMQYRIRALDSTGDSGQAVVEIQKALQNPSLAKEHESLRSKAAEIVDNRLSREELEDVADDYPDTTVRARAHFRLGELTLEDKDFSSARSHFARVVNLVPSTDLGEKAQDLLSQLEAVKRVEPKTVGVVLPLSGRHAAIAQKSLRGIQMGLGLHNSNVSSFKLAVVDSEANPDLARKGVERLVKEDNVIAVIGSLLSKTAPGVASKTSELGVPSIALSQKAGITESGPSVFRNSLTSEMQVRHLVKVAMEDLGLRKFAVLYPNDQYGVEYANIFWDEVLARGGTIQAAQTYSAKETDFRNVVQRLVGTYYLEDRADEYKLRLKEWADAQTKKTARNTPPEDLLPPIVDFDAIFIPDSAKSLGQISAMLAFNNVRGVKLLGTNLWNVPGLSKRTGNSAKDLLFVDSYVSSDQNYIHSQFVKEYRALFNEDPGIFEIQAYDAAYMLRQLIAQGNTSRESLSNALSQLKDFPGAIGSLNMSPQREVLRPLVALTIEGAEVVPVRRR
ncbi:MAG: hypothetical protein BroJett040_09010 [Oligoflexia bacterium]|nr:MAG: hypothetical protein BroJett040_09010 [Oligoflexia bacterium]